MKLGNVEWNYNYWIPQVDMTKGKTNYYHLSKWTQYYIMFYYCILNIIGNDINPTTMNEFLMCTSFVFIGAFLEAYIIGGITAE